MSIFNVSAWFSSSKVGGLHASIAIGLQYFRQVLNIGEGIDCCNCCSGVIILSMDFEFCHQLWFVLFLVFWFLHKVWPLGKFWGCSVCDLLGCFVQDLLSLRPTAGWWRLWLAFLWFFVFLVCGAQNLVCCSILEDGYSIEFITPEGSKLVWRRNLHFPTWFFGSFYFPKKVIFWGHH